VGGGFSVSQAIRIATLNGATFLGLDNPDQTISTGKQAELVVFEENSVREIADTQNCEAACNR
jgi:imidazolonepropionase-like amidohydrolase